MTRAITCTCVLLVIAASISLFAGCKGSNDAGSLLEHSPSVFEHDVAALKAPPGVDAELWLQMKEVLLATLVETEAHKRTQTAPNNDASKVTDLDLLLNGAVTVEWSYRNLGDYDQNGEVNLSDITPIGTYYGATSASPNWPAAQLADGDENGEVNLADITPIGLGFFNTVNGYKLQISATPENETSWLEVGEIAFADGIIPASGGRREFVAEITDPIDENYYRVVPYHESSLGIASNAEQYNDPVVIPQVENVIATKGTMVGEILISWDALADAVSYDIERRENLADPFAVIDNVVAPATEYADSTVVVGTHYNYRVIGQLAEGPVAPSLPVEGWAMEPPAAPLNFTASDNTSQDHIALAWDNVPAATQFIIYRSLTAGSGYMQLDTSIINSYNDTTPVPGTPYYYYVVAQNDAGISIPSNEDEGTRQPTGPLPVIDGVSPQTGPSGSQFQPVVTTSGGAVDTWSWDFGMGATPNVSADESPIVILGAEGQYDASIKVTNAFGSDTFDFTLDVTENIDPRITGVDPLHGETESIVVFTATLVNPTTGTWSWDFGDGASPNTSDQETPTVVLGQPGDYDASVNFDWGTGSDDFAFTLTVDPLAPEIVGVTPVTSNVGEFETFIISHAGGLPDTWDWNFGGAGNPNTSTAEEPVVEMIAEGDFTVTVDVSNVSGSDHYEYTLSVDPELLIHTWGGLGEDYGYQTRLDSTGALYVGGRTLSFGQGGGDMLLIKYDNQGDYDWALTWGGVETDVLTDISIDGSNNILLGGYTKSTGGGTDDNIALVSLDSTGALNWSTTWGGTLSERVLEVDANSSGIVACGYATDATTYALTAKFDSAGTNVWAKSWYTGLFAFANDVVVDALGNIYVVGTTWINAPDDEQHDGFLITYSPSGAIGLQCVYRDVAGAGMTPGSSESFNTVNVDSLGNIYVAGVRTGEGEDPDYVVTMKLDVTGAILWQKTWDSPGDDSLLDILPDGSGNVWVTGYTEGLGSGSKDLLLLQYDSAGNLLQENIWGSVNDDEAAGLSFDGDGHLRVSGTAPSNQGVWTTDSGVDAVSSFTMHTVTGTGADWSGTATAPVATIDLPSFGVVHDVGGGGSDALFMKVLTS